jgi:hypothetical protein
MRPQQQAARSLIAGLIAGIVLLAGASLARAEQPTNRADIWAAYAETGRTGDAVCGIRKALPNGAELRLVMAGQEVHLLARDPSWSLRGAQTRVAVTIGRDTYVGVASVMAPDTLVVESLSADFMDHFMAAPSLKAEFGAARWHVDLRGSGDAAWSMADCAGLLHHPANT